MSGLTPSRLSGLWLAVLLAVAQAAAQPRPEATPEDGTRALLGKTLERASAYVEEYMPALGTLIAREAYVQNLLEGGVQVQQRRLDAEFVLVFVPAQQEWLGFRDVIEVDGRVQRDRAARLRRLFPAGRPVALRRLIQESARFNIGRFYRNVNLPPLALTFLRRTVIGGLSFGLKGETTVDGTRALEVLFREDARPTLIREHHTKKDVPASGSFWIDPATGRVLKTRLWLTTGQLTAEITITYQPDGALDLWVPVTMRELYVAPGPTEVEGIASYSGFQRATAETSETYQLPHWGEAVR